MLLLTLLTAAVLQAAPGDSLFVQVSSLNLRAKPKTSATIRMQVPIGSACSVVSLAKDGWAELRCSQGTGFGKLDLLGPTLPDHAQLLAQGQEPGRPLSEAMNLLQRALALKPSDAPTQQAFRELFWKAELERLVRARTANDTLKPPREPTSFPEACDDPAACVKAALKPESDSEVAWQEARVEGTDVVLAQLFADGLFHLRSGALDPDKRTITVQLESLMVPSTAVLNALGAHDIQDACQPLSRGYDNAQCGFEYDQNCGPHSDCFEAYASCDEQTATSCQECKRACGGTCGDCRMKCGTHNRKECVARCIEATQACEQQCQEPADTGFASCKAEMDTCSVEEEREWNRTCETPCERVYACVSRCEKKGTSTWTCVERCDDRLPKSCSNRCLFRYQ